MENLQETIKAKLLLSDEDVEPLLNGDFKTLFVQNKEAAVRVGIAFGCGLICILLFLSLFSVFGAFGKVFLTLLFFGAVGALCFLFKSNLLKITQYPICFYFWTCVFGLITLSMFSGISSQGSLLSKLLMLLILGGIGGGVYTVRQRAADFGFSMRQIILVSLTAASFLLSLQVAAIQFSIDSEIEMAQKRSELRRLRDAEQMQRNNASTKVCSSEEECRKMNMKKNSYYAQYEETAQDLCENATAKEISGRFEWTVSAKDYKFNKYEVDVLKDEITLFGDRAQLIANDGTRTKIMYTCRYNTKKKTAIASVVPAKP
ncbi:MAG: hypothetical protein IJ752_04495 [Alphaproteobacteria bacterium]|nr:hypothetical protein [Alphaproteobacteria bacterium]